MKRAVRLRVLAGLSSIATMMAADALAADASAQGCSAWLSWVCGESASSNKPGRKEANTPTKGIRKEKQLSQARGAPAEKPKRTQALEPAPMLEIGSGTRKYMIEKQRCCFTNFSSGKRTKARIPGLTDESRSWGASSLTRSSFAQCRILSSTWYRELARRHAVMTFDLVLQIKGQRTNHHKQEESLRK